ncbi:unnamed protein product [Parajaminaea phylloscopi]
MATAVGFPGSCVVTLPAGQVFSAETLAQRACSFLDLLMEPAPRLSNLEIRLRLESKQARTSLLIPAYFRAGSKSEGSWRQNATDDQDRQQVKRCFLSGLAARVELAHLFDATRNPSLIRELAASVASVIPATSDKPTVAASNPEGIQGPGPSSPEANSIPLDVGLHCLLDERARIGPVKVNVLLVCPMEYRVGLVSIGDEPDTYTMATLQREAKDNLSTEKSIRV